MKILYLNVAMLAFVLSTTSVIADSSSYYQLFYQYGQQLQPVWNNFYNNFKPYQTIPEEKCSVFPGLSVVSDCDVRYLAGQMHRWTDDSNNVLSKISKELKLLLKVWLTEFSGPGKSSASNTDKPSGPSTTKAPKQVTVSTAIPSTTSTVAPTTTPAGPVCSNPVLFIAFRDQSYKKYSFNTYIPTADGGYTVCNRLELTGRVFSMIPDRTNMNLYILEGGKTLIAYTRDLLTGVYTKTATKNLDSAYDIALDDSQKFLLTGENDSGKIKAYAIKPDTFEEVASTVPDASSKPTITAFHPKNKNLLAVCLSGLKRIQFYEFNSLTPTITQLPIQADLPAGFKYPSFVFSPDGKYMFAVGSINKVVVFELTFDASNALTEVKQKGSVESLSEDDTKESQNIVRIDPKGEYLFTTVYNPLSITTFKITDGSLSMRNIQKVLEEYTYPDDMVITPNGKQLLLSDGSLSVYVYDIGEYALLTKNTTLSGTTGPITMYYRQ